MSDFSKLPSELVTQIFFYIDSKTLIVCTQVCRKWKSTIQDLGFWMRFHIFNRQGAAKGIPEAVFQRGLDWTFFAKINPEKNPFGSNLMRNGCTEEVSSDELQLQENRVEVDGLMEPWPTYPHWQILSCAGDGWKIERSEEGTSMLKLAISPKEKVTESHLYSFGCYVGSFHSCSKEQVIDLVENGFDPEILDNPDFLFQISSEEWYTVTGSACFEMSFALLDEQKNVIICYDARRGYRLHKHSDYGFWQRNSIVHSGSLVKCRYIHFYHGGTADGVDFEEIAQLRSIKIKMTKVKLEISYPCLKNAS